MTSTDKPQGVPADRPDTRVRKARMVAGSIAVVVTLLVAVLATRPVADSEIAASPLIGGVAPTVKGIALDGRFVDSATLTGRYVVVNFFATWCLPCRQEHPEIKAFSEQSTGEADPVVVAVAYDKNDIPATRSFFAQYGGTWPVLPDDGGRIAVSYGVRGLPETYVIDRQGLVKARVTGAVTADQLTSLTRDA